ncbi:MAG: DUF5610 domain-containing protein [Candidatus Hydrogenedentes bacterium]|nr:DUF5610 domain-containing protein [Candidatus Hydrogenedentota bacterium]
MVNTISSVNLSYSASLYQRQTTALASQAQEQTAGLTDQLDFGKSGVLSTDDAMSILYERSMAKLQSVVEDARAALGLSETSVLDTSPEATAGRIADFALNFFDAWRQGDESRMALSDEEAREQFVNFIGGAIDQGFQEARGILDSLSALSTDINDGIDSTYEIIQQRLLDFVANG